MPLPIGAALQRHVAHFLLGLALLLSAGVDAFAQPKLLASLDRDTITLGESAVLTLQFEGGRPAQAPPIAAPQDLGIAYAGQSSETRIENGRMSSALKLTYRVTPRRAGEFTVPAIQVVVDRKNVASQPLRLRVLKPGGSTSDPNTGLTRYAFLKLIVPKTTVYQGEVLPVEVQLYAATRGEQLQIPQLQSEGFSFSQMIPSPQNQNPPQAQSGNTVYTVLTFKTTATAVKSGRLNLGPAQCSLVLHIPSARRARDPLEEFFDFSSRVQRQAVTLTSEPAELEVLPLPGENRPDDFTGAVGSYDWVVTASPTNVTTGDPITVKIRLSGEGALDGLSPRQEDWREFKSYPPTSKTETTDPLGVSGVKTFEQVIVPQNADVKEIPAMQFSFFDPQKKAYRTLMHPAMGISVKPSTGGQPQPTVVAGAAPSGGMTQPASDIVHIKPYLGQLLPAGLPLVETRWFLALQGIPLIAWFAVFAWRKRQDALARNPRRRRRLATADAVRVGLRDLKRLADEDQSEEFFATVFRLLQEQLGERLDLPASAITESVLDERVRPLGAPEELMSLLHGLFQACNQARYAGSVGSKELNSLLPGVETALRDLQKLEDRNGS
jgi:hypothetical protein